MCRCETFLYHSDMKNNSYFAKAICLAVLFCVFNTHSSAQIDLYLRYKSKIDSLKKGLTKLPFEHEKLVWVNERGACFQLPGGKRGICTLDGRVYIPAQFSAIHTEPHNNFFAENFETKKWGVLDSAGHELIPFGYDEVEDVSDYYGEYAPLIKCKSDRKWAFFDLKGNKLTDHIYLKAFWQPVAPEVLVVQNANNKWQFLNLKGQPMSAWEFDDLEFYPNGLVVEKDKKFGFYSYQGTPLTELKYRDAYGFKDAEDAKAKAQTIGLPENLTLVGSADISFGNSVWIDSAGGEHPIH